MLGFAVALVAPGVSRAQTGTYNADTPADPATESRLKDLAQELRCLVCQNQTIADSSADLAVDLRREVRAQILAGKSDTEIKSFLVARYGDFVLYKPPVQGNTALLWFGPFTLLMLGGVVWWFFIRRRRAAIAVADTVSPEDENRARALLDELPPKESLPMYGLIGKIRSVPGQRDVLASILIAGTTAMPGCLSYVVAADSADPDALWVTEVWESSDAHRASLSLPAVQQAIGKGKPLIASFGERFETRPIGGCGLVAAAKSA